MGVIDQVTQALLGFVDSFAGLVNAVIIISGIAAVLLLVVPDEFLGNHTDGAKKLFVACFIGALLLKIIVSLA